MYILFIEVSDVMDKCDVCEMKQRKIPYQGLSVK